MDEKQRSQRPEDGRTRAPQGPATPSPRAGKQVGGVFQEDAERLARITKEPKKIDRGVVDGPMALKVL